MHHLQTVIPTKLFIIFKSKFPEVKKIVASFPEVKKTVASFPKVKNIVASFPNVKNPNAKITIREIFLTHKLEKILTIITEDFKYIRIEIFFYMQYDDNFAYLILSVIHLRDHLMFL